MTDRAAVASAEPLTAGELRAAALVVAGLAQDAQDAGLLLDALGIRIGPRRAEKRDPTKEARTA